MTLRICHLFCFWISMLNINLIISSAEYPPIMITQSRNELLYEVKEKSDLFYTYLTLKCKAEGNPEPIYHWKKNGVKFDYTSYDERIIQLSGNGTLVIDMSKNIDGGFYQCFAENIHGTAVSDSVFLRKYTLPQFPVTETKLVIAKEGKPLTLKCDLPSGYPKPVIVWLFANLGNLYNITNSRLTVDPEGNLHFSSITKEDFRTFVCGSDLVFRAVYKEPKLGNRIKLEVEKSDESAQVSNELIRQYVSPPEMLVLRSHSISLSCIFGGVPMPLIEWRKIDGNLNSPRYQYEHNGRTLKISPVIDEDEATYECTASNGVGKPQTHTMKVKVEAAPYWIETTKNTNCSKGGSVKFTCEASGNPEPKLQWYINGVSIQKVKPNPRRIVQGNSLIIESILKFDTAVYQCNASNVHGYAFHNFYLKVSDSACISRFDILNEKINLLEKKIDYIIAKFKKDEKD